MRRRAFLLLTAASAAAAATAGGAYVATRPPRSPARTDTLTRPLVDFDASVEYDTCIVGSGIASAVVAGALVAEGRRVAVLESGFSPNDEWATGLQQLEAFHAAGGGLEYPYLQTRMRALGGTSGIWTGNCLRYLPSDFEAHPGSDTAWPLSYADLEPYYERAEELLAVRGWEGSRFAPPRRRPLPLPFGGRMRYLARSALSSERVPASPLQQALLGRGMETDYYPQSHAGPGPARASLHDWPTASLDERITIATGATVTRLLFDGSGVVTAAEARGFDGTVKRIRARRFVIAAGGVESARLLLLSKSRDFPNGLGNDHDLVGRFFTESPFRTYTTSVPPDLRETFGRVRLLQYHHPEFREGLAGITLAVGHARESRDVLELHAGISMAPVPENRWALADGTSDLFGNPLPALTFGFSELDAATLERGRTLLRSLCDELGVAPPVEQPGVGWSHHHIGTCRMGDDPSAGVVNADCRLHASPNCYLAGSAVFTNPGAGHPTLLLAALAHRLGEHLGGLRT